MRQCWREKRRWRGSAFAQMRFSSVTSSTFNSSPESANIRKRHLCNFERHDLEMIDFTRSGLGLVAPQQLFAGLWGGKFWIDKRNNCWELRHAQLQGDRWSAIWREIYQIVWKGGLGLIFPLCSWNATATVALIIQPWQHHQGRGGGVRVVCKRRGEDKEVRSNQIMKAFSSFVLNICVTETRTPQTVPMGKVWKTFRWRKIGKYNLMHLHCVLLHKLFFYRRTVTQRRRSKRKEDLVEKENGFAGLSQHLFCRNNSCITKPISLFKDKHFFQKLATSSSSMKSHLSFSMCKYAT